MKLGVKTVTDIFFGKSRISAVYINKRLSYEGVSNKLSYTLSSDGTYYTVSGIGTYNGRKLYIPNTYKGLPVQEIAEDAFNGNSNIKYLHIGKNVKTIGKQAFRDCPIVDIVIPNGVTKICQSAFEVLNGIEGKPTRTVYIPRTTTRIEAFAFDYAISTKENGWTEITYAGSKGEWAQYFGAYNAVCETGCRVKCSNGYLN